MCSSDLTADRLRLAVHLVDVGSRAPMLPAPAEHMTGELTIAAGELSFAEVRATMGGAPVRCTDGRVRTLPAPDLRTEVAFTVQATGVPVDDGHNENWLDEAAINRVEQLLGGLPADRPRLLLVVQGTDCRRFWNADRWVALMRWLVETRGCELFFCGGRADASLRAQLREAAGPEVAAHLHDHSADLSLGEAGALVARMNLCVSVDTGLVHLAASFHVPVVVLVGPTDPNQWSPWDTPAAVVRSSRVRRRLGDRMAERAHAARGRPLRWPLGRASMNDITVADVQQRITELLAARNPSTPEPPPIRR